MRPLLCPPSIAASTLPSFWLRNQLRRSCRELQHSFPRFERPSDFKIGIHARGVATRQSEKIDHPKLSASANRLRSYAHFLASRSNTKISGCTTTPRNKSQRYGDYRRLFTSQTNHPRESRKRRSPYAVLGFGKRGGHSIQSITHDEIKAAFRRLAKIYHPDLNPEDRPIEECEALMSELVDAYERLLRTDTDDEDDFLENIRVGASNKVALACELYSVQELTMDRFHAVHSLRIEYNDDEGENWTETEAERQIKTRDLSSTCLPQTTASFAIPIQAHPGDSVLDLKERLGVEFGDDWGLDDCLGWELLAFQKSRNSSTNVDSEDPTTVAVHNEVLSYHLFLEDYQIQHGDIIYAIVRQHED